MDFKAIKSNGDITKMLFCNEIVWSGDEIEMLLNRAKRDYRILISGLPYDNDQIIRTELTKYDFRRKVETPGKINGYENLIIVPTYHDVGINEEGYFELIIEIKIIEPNSKRRINKMYVVQCKDVPLPPPPSEKPNPNKPKPDKPKVISE